MRNKYLKYATVFVILKEISCKIKISKVDARQRQSLQIDKRKSEKSSKNYYNFIKKALNMSEFLKYLKDR